MAQRSGTYIIAEIGSVHDGSLGNAIRLIEEVAKAGADAAKFQDHRGEKVKGDPPWFKGGEKRGDYLKRTSFTQEQWSKIRESCSAFDARFIPFSNMPEKLRSRGVDLLVSPFSVEAVGLLEQLPVDAYKIASGQITNLPMLEAIGKTGRRVILSSGMTTMQELHTASAMSHPWAVLQCTSSYPCPPEQVGLNQLGEWLAFQRHTVRAGVLDAMPYELGLSDHTLGFAASLAAIALGATVIERHVCFDRRGYGTDCAHSLTLDEFGAFVREVRSLDTMLANPVNKDELAASPEMSAMREAFLEQP